MTIKEKLLNKFKDVIIDEELHKYTINGKPLKSTSKFIEGFSTPFNSWFASNAKGKSNIKKNPKSIKDGKYYRQRWKFIADTAKNLGHRVHLFAESYPYFDDPMDWREEAIVSFFKWLPSNYEVITLELRIGDEEIGLGGTLDCLLRNKETNKYVIVDWKTNDRNLHEVYGNKKLKHEFKDLFATKLNHYSIQLSNYQVILESNTPLKIEERWIVWIHKGDDTILDLDRSNGYDIQHSLAFEVKELFKIYKTKDLTTQLKQSYLRIKEENEKPKEEIKEGEGYYGVL